MCTGPMGRASFAIQPIRDGAMNVKQRRHQKILELINTRAIGRQETLGEALRAEGILTTQSTLSKDIKELGVMKAPDGSGGFRYQVPTAVGRMALQGDDLLQRELQDFVVAVDGAENMLVVKTITGHAQGVCEAIDQADWPDVVGTIAGENTIFMLCRSKAACEKLKQDILDVTGEV